MQLTEENAVLVDDFLLALQHHFDSGKGECLTIPEYLQLDGNMHKLDVDIYHAFIIANYKQHKLEFKAFQMNIIKDWPTIDYQKGFTDAFLASGGFSAIWKDEEADRTERLATNKSVRKTNKLTRMNIRFTKNVFMGQILIAIASVLVACVTAVIYWFIYDLDKSNVNAEGERLKQLEKEQPKIIERINKMSKSIDSLTFYIKSSQTHR